MGLGMSEKDPQQIYEERHNSIIDTTEQHEEKNELLELGNEKASKEQEYLEQRKAFQGMKEKDEEINVDIKKFGMEVNAELQKSALSQSEDETQSLGSELETTKKARILGSGDSKEMTRVKTSVKKVKDLYETDRKSDVPLLEMTKNIEEAYLDAINECQNYLNTKSFFFGNARYKAVLSTMNRLNKDLGYITAFKLSQARMTDEQKAQFLNASDIMYYAKVKELGENIGIKEERADDGKKYYNGKEVTEKDRQPASPEDVAGVLNKLEKTPKYIAGLFMGVNSPTELKRKLGSDGTDIANELLKVLQRFKPNTAHVEYINTATFGYKGDYHVRMFADTSGKLSHTTMALMQEEDGTFSLRIIEKDDSKILQLPFTAASLFEDVQDDMMEHEDIFGKEFTNNALDWIKSEKLDIVKQGKLRGACTTLIERRYGLEHEKFGAVLRSVPVEKLREAAIKLISNEAYSKQDFFYDNDIIEYRNKVVVGRAVTSAKVKDKALADIKKKQNDNIIKNDSKDDFAELKGVFNVFGDKKEDENIINTNSHKGMSEKDDFIKEEDNMDFLKDFEFVSVERAADKGINTDEILEKVEHSKKEDVASKVIHSETNKKKKKDEIFEIAEEEELLAEKEKQEVLRRRQKKEAEARAKRLKEEKEEEEYKKKTEWNEKEDKIKNLIADLFFSSDSVLADNAVKKFDPDEARYQRLFNVIINNAEILSDIRKDKNILLKFINRIALPIGAEKGELFDKITDVISSLPADISKGKLTLGLMAKKQDVIKLDKALDAVTEGMASIIQKKLTEAMKEMTEKQDADAKKKREEAAFKRIEADAKKRIGEKYGEGTDAAKEYQEKLNAELNRLNAVMQGQFKKLLDEHKEDEAAEFAEQEQVKISDYKYDHSLNAHIRKEAKKLADEEKEKYKLRAAEHNPDEQQSGIEDLKTQIADSRASAPANETKEQKYKREAPILRKVVNDSLSGNSGQGLFMKNVLNDYFGSVSLMDKRAMIGEALRNLKPVPKTDEDLLNERKEEMNKADYEKAVAEIRKLNEEIRKRNAAKKEKYDAEKKAYDSKQGGGLFGMFKGWFVAGNAEEEEKKKEPEPVMEKLEKEMEIPEYEEKVKAVEKYEEKYAEEQMGLMIGGLFKGAGPLLQKILQGMPVNKDTNVYFRKALEDVKSNLLPISKEIVDAQLVDMINKSNGKITRIEIVNSLGAASVGQAFLCKMYGPGQNADGREVVVKILRPDVQNRMEREKDVLLKCAEKTNAGMRATYEGQLKRIEEELNLVIEAKNVKLGQIYDKSYNKDKSYDNVESMKLCDLVEGTEDYMVAEKAEGVTVDRYIKNIDKKLNDILEPFYYKYNDNYVLDGEGKKQFKVTKDNVKKHFNTVDAINEMTKEAIQCQKHLITLAEKWVTEGLFGEGFYHGDLHAGNIMISPNKATVIDFGNSTQLSDEDRVQITRMMVGAGDGDVDLFMESYKNLMSKGEAMQHKFEQQKGNFKAILKPLFELGDARLTGERIATALLKAQELGLELPSGIQNFSTCQLRLANTITDLNDKIEMLKKTAKELSVKTEARGDDHLDYIKSTKDSMLKVHNQPNYWSSVVLSIHDQLSVDKHELLSNTFFKESDETRMPVMFTDEMDVSENIEQRREHFKKMIDSDQFSENGYNAIAEFITEVEKLEALPRNKMREALDENQFMFKAHKIRNILDSFSEVVNQYLENGDLEAEDPVKLELDELLEDIDNFSNSLTNNLGENNMPAVKLRKVLTYYERFVGKTSVEEDVNEYWKKLDEFRQSGAIMTGEKKDELDAEKYKIWKKYKMKFLESPNIDGNVSDRRGNAVNHFQMMSAEEFHESMKSYYSDEMYGEELRKAVTAYYDSIKQAEALDKQEMDSWDRDHAKRELSNERAPLIPQIMELIDKIALYRMNDLKEDKKKITESLRKSFGATDDFMDVMGRVMQGHMGSSFKRMGALWTLKNLNRVINS